jgi:hypothetical protein
MEQREQARRRRRRAIDGAVIEVPFDGPLEPLAALTEPPADLRLATTDDSGEVAHWFDDYFWVELIQRWGKVGLSITFLPTANALLHSVLDHHVRMLRRVAPIWRMTGQCYLTDLEPDGALPQAALSLYHELHIIDAPRNPALPSAKPLRVEDAMARIRQIQAANNRTTPIVVCCRPTVPRSPARANGPAEKRPREVNAPVPASPARPAR